MVDFGKDPIMVKVLKAGNVKGKTLDQIKEKDKKQKAHAGVVDYMQSLMDSECGKHLRGIKESAPYYAEIFVMDNQSGNVAMTDKNSDYCQGDKAKFKKYFGGVAGAVSMMRLNSMIAPRRP